MDNNFLGINFGFTEKKFFVEYPSCSRPVGNLKEEFEQRARDLFSYNKKLMLGISSGLDSQAVMHSFCSQGLDIKYAFLHMPGYNDFEFNNLKILEKKYSIDFIVIEIDPVKIKDDLLQEYKKTEILPSHIIQAKFLKQLPDDYDFIQGINGPDFFISNNQCYILETANSMQISRLRAFLNISRIGRIIGWERTPEITTSLLTDDVVTSFINSYNYISTNNLIYKTGKEITIANYWDLYIKPFIYGKYWKNELEYFSKQSGFENLDWIENGPKHNYKKNSIKISYNHLIDHLLSRSGKILKFYEK